MCSTGCTELLSFRHVSNVRHVGSGAGALWGRLDDSKGPTLEGAPQGGGKQFLPGGTRSAISTEGNVERDFYREENGTRFLLRGTQSVISTDFY